MKDTIIIKVDAENIDDKSIERCAEILRKGGIVAFPTETVYGLGADALNPKAVRKVFVAKNRPFDKPLIIHISRIQDVFSLAKRVPKLACRAMEKFWPGPLTLVLDKSKIVPCETSGGLSTVAVRMPNHPIAIKLIEKLEAPIAAPSANISGKLSPTKVEHVIEDLTGKVDAIIAGGDCNIGIESTVVDMTGKMPIILRSGGITQEMLEEVLGKVLVNFPIKNFGGAKTKSESTGIRYIDYLPNAEMVIIQGNLNDTVAKIKKLKSDYKQKGKKVGIICTDETKNKYAEDTEKTIIKSLGSRKCPKTIAANLFSVLREFDKTGVETILCESVDSMEIGHAIMDRLEKAAKGRIIRT